MTEVSAAPFATPALMSVSAAGSAGASTPTDPTSFTITQADAALRAGEITAVEILQAFTDRIRRHDPVYNAFVLLNPRALHAARAADQRLAQGWRRGPLDGVPIVVKASIDTAGLRTSAAWSGVWPEAGGVELLPVRDAAIVRRLRDAGAVIVGKTNLPMFAGSGDNANDSVHGGTFNALDRRWAPGGSSTGTATAVAAGFAVAGIGEETGGSIQNPAAAQSLVAVKPTFGLVPNTGGVPQAASTRDVLGPMTTTVEDAALVLDVIAGCSPHDPTTRAVAGRVPPGGYTSRLSPVALRGTRLGLYGPGWRTDALTPETQRLYDAAIAAIAAQGSEVVPDPFAGSGFANLAMPVDGYDARGTEDHAYELDRYLRALGPYAAVHSLADLQAATGVPLFGQGGPLNVYMHLPGLRASLRNPTRPPDLSAFARLRAEHLRIFEKVMTSHRLDALVFPQQYAPIGDLHGGAISATTVSEVNIAGLPAVVVPAGRYASGRPFSLIFVGRPWSEVQLLAYAYAYSAAEPGRAVPRQLG